MADPGTADFLETPVFTIIETERLRLRTFSVTDAKAILPILSDKEVMRWTTQQTPITDLSVARKWTSARALGKDVFNFVMELKLDGQDNTASARNEIIGIMGSRGFPEIGYMLHPGYQGMGYATEALRAYIPKLFERMPSAEAGGVGFNYIEGCTDSENTASRRVLEKCGLTLCVSIANDPHSPIPGVRSTVFYRIARPGYSLDKLGLTAAESSRPKDHELMPPIQ